MQLQMTVVINIIKVQTYLRTQYGCSEESGCSKVFSKICWEAQATRSKKISTESKQTWKWNIN